MSEGYGHDRPLHKPEDLQQAVAEIKRRWTALEAGIEPDQADSQRELEEILIWLPELAAETDLRRAEWDHVHHLSKQLLRRFQHSFDSREHRSVISPAPPESWRDAWQQLADVADGLPEVKPTHTEVQE